jgi:protein O-mannosyl-transferase
MMNVPAEIWRKQIQMGSPAEPMVMADASESGESSRSQVWVLAALLGLATLGVYASTTRNGFVDFDDRDYVTLNEHVKAGLSWQNIEWAFRTIEAANWHPLTWISHMADCQIFGLNPAGHHAVSATLHAMNAVLLFLLLEKSTGLRWRSLCVAALFALHPLNVETVAWISERKSLLSMLFSLLAVGCYGWYARTADSERGQKWRRYLAVVACFALALLSKPMAVTLPAVFLLLDYWPLERLPVPHSGGNANEFWKSLRTLVVEKVPLILMSIASSWVTVVAQKRGHAMSGVAVLAIQQRLGNALVSYMKYIGKMFWPSGLAYYYPHPGNRLAAWQILAAGLLLLAITAVVWRLRERRHLVFGWALFIIMLLPVIGLVQVGLQAMADRYAYIPLIGLFVVLLWELGGTAERLRLSTVALGIAASGLCSLLAVVTVVNIGYWRDSITLGTHAREVIPFANTRIETNLGAALLDRGRTAEAIEHFRIAESLAPDMFIPHFNIGYSLAQTGDNAGALPELKAAVRSGATVEERARALNSLAVAYLDVGENEEAAQAFSELLAIRSDSVQGHAGRGQAFFNMGRYDEASEDFVAAARSQPAPELLLMAGKSMEAAGKFPEAAEAYRRALNGNAALAEARDRLNLLEERSSLPMAIDKK